MNNYVSTEKSLKKWLKSRVKITMATVVGFLIAGTVTFGAGEIPVDGVYTNDYLLNTFQSTKVVVGKDGNLIINSNGSVGHFLSDLQKDHSFGGIRKALSQHEQHGKDNVIVTGALAGQGRFSEGVKQLQKLGDFANNLINNQTIGKVLDILKRTNTNEGTPIEGNTNTVIGNENSPVVLGLIGGDMSVGVGKIDVDIYNLLSPKGATITSSKEKEDLQIIRNGNSTVTINNGNVFGGVTGSTALSLGNISAKGKKSITIKGLTATIKGDLNLNGNTTTTINGNTNLNINNGANAMGITSGGLATAIGGTATSNINGDSNIVVKSKVDEKELSGLTVGLLGGGMAVSTLGGEATSNITGTTNVTIENGLSVGVLGGGLAVSTDASQYLKNGTLGGKIDENGKFVVNKDGIPPITISGLKEGGKSTVELGNVNLNLKGTTAVAGALGNGIAVSHQNAPQGSTAENATNKISSSTVTAKDVTVNVDLTKNLTGAIIGEKGVIKEVKEVIAQLKNIVDPSQGTNVNTVIKEMQDAVGVLKDGGIVVGLGGNGVAVARDKGISEVTAKNITMNLKGGYLVGVVGNGVASGNASSTVKAETSVINIDGAEVIGISGSGLALDHGVVKDNTYSKTEIKDTTINLNSGSADGIFGGGVAITKDHVDSKAEAITTGKSIINVNGGTVDKFGYNHVAGIIGTHGSFDKIAEAGKDVAITAGGVASRNGYTKVVESEININGGVVNGNILAGGIAVAGGISEVGKSTINITGGDIKGSIYGTGIAISEDATINKVDKNKTSATVENAILNINGYQNSLEKIAGFNEINIGANTKASTDESSTKLTITEGIEVGKGALTNAGTVIFDNKTENSTLIKVAEGGTVLNKGLIVVDKGDIVVDNTNDKAKDVKNTGKIQVNGITSSDKEKFDVKNLFAGKFTNVGMVVGTDGKAILTNGEDVVAGDVTIEEIMTDATKDKVTLEHVTIKESGTINSDAVNVIGNVTNDVNFEIADGSLNFDKEGNISIKDATEMTISNVTVNGSGNADIKFAGENSKLVLNNSSVDKNGVIGENTTNGIVDFVGTENSFNGKINAREINIDKGNAVEFGENAIGAGTITLNGDAKIAVGKENTNGVYAQNFFHNSDANKLTVNGNGNIIIRTKNFTGEKVTVDFGQNNIFDTDLINKLDTTNVYMIEEGEDLTDGKLNLVYNNKLFEENPVLNEIHKAGQVVNGKFSEDKETRLSEYDKHYATNIYSETVKATYDNIKLNEEVVESLARKSEVGKWTAEGKAIYSKKEYDRNGTLKDYSSEIESTGLMAGFGYGVKETTTVGVAFSGVKQDIDTDGGNADADLFYLGVYGNKVYGNYDLTAGLGYQFGKYEADNTILESTGDKYDSQAISGYVQGRYTADLGEGLSVQPKVRLGYTYVEQDNTKDSYFGVEDAEISTYDAEVGVDTVKSVQLEKSKLNVKLGASYIKTMGDTDKEFTGKFYGTKTSEGFNVLGAELTENVVKFNLGAEVENENGFFYNGGLTYEFGSNDTEAYGVNVGVGYKF